MIRFARQVLLLLSVLSGACFADDALVPILSPTPAVPTTIVQPDFPPGAQAPADGVKVDVTGVVHPGGVYEPSSITAPPGHEVFAKAVADVLKWWSFVPAIDSRKCAAKSEQFSMTIWFEGSSKDPRVFVTLPKDLKAKDAAPQSPAIESITAPKIAHPYTHQDIEGQVRVLLLVTPAGQVESVQVVSSAPAGAFDRTVLAHARRTAVKWKDPPEGPVCVRRTYTFCMAGSQLPRAVFSGCRR